MGERYDRELTDVFALQDDITGQIVSALSVQLSDDDKRQIQRNKAGNFEAYDLFLKAQEYDTNFTREGGELSIATYRQVIKLDPNFARAYGALAVALSRQVLRGYASRPVETLERALVLAQEAVSIDPESPQAQWSLGYIYMQQK